MKSLRNLSVALAAVVALGGLASAESAMARPHHHAHAASRGHIRGRHRQKATPVVKSAPTPPRTTAYDQAQACFSAAVKQGPQVSTAMQRSFAFHPSGGESCLIDMTRDSETAPFNVAMQWQANTDKITFNLSRDADGGYAMSYEAGFGMQAPRTASETADTPPQNPVQDRAFTAAYTSKFDAFRPRVFVMKTAALVQ